MGSMVTRSELNRILASREKGTFTCFEEGVGNKARNSRRRILVHEENSCC